MKITVKTRTCDIEVQATTVKGAVKEMAEAQAVFGNDTCLACQSSNVRFGHRVHNGNDFYEIICSDCNHRLGLSQLKDGGGLFVKRKDKEGNWLPNNGWVEPWKGTRSAAAGDEEMPF